MKKTAATSCAPKYNASTQKPVASMGCVAIQEEYTQLKAIRTEAEGKSGVSAENVAWALLFWPGALVNEMDNRDVIQKVDARTAELVKAGDAKTCPALN